MTVIAIKDGIIAADSRVMRGDVIVGTTIKIARGPYCVAGATGAAGFTYAFLAWVRDGMDPAKRPMGKSVDNWTDTGVVVYSNYPGRFHVYDAADPPHFIDADLFAIGIGSFEARGAMAAGISPCEAVDIACRFACQCGPPIMYLDLHDNGVPIEWHPRPAGVNQYTE